MTGAWRHPLVELPKYGSPGPGRLLRLVELLDLGDYLAATRRIAVTGTNGKGSTAKFAAEILRAAGLRTGLFTSPHLYRFNERIEIAGRPVPDEQLTPAADAVLAAVRRLEREQPGERVIGFESFLALALLLFARAQLPALVLEAGVGGRWDPVRWLESPLAALVSVDLDHTELLGDTLAAIAADKVEIVAPGGAIVLGPAMAPYAEQLAPYVRSVGARLSLLPPCREGADLTVDGQVIDGVHNRLAGGHQVENLTTAAVLAGRLLRCAGRFEPERFASAVRSAAAHTRWPGRLEQVRTDPDVTIDVGHSPSAIRAALAGFAAGHDLSGCLLVTGCSRDKDAAGMLAVLAPAFDRILCTSARHKGQPAATIAGLARAANPAARVEAVEPVAAAADRLLEICRAEGRCAYAAGGLFVTVELAHALAGGDPGDLDFF